MPALNPPRSNVAILIFLLAFQLFLMSDSARRSGLAPSLERFLMRISSPGVVLADWLAGGLRGSVTAAGDLFAAHARNTALEGEVKQLRSELVRYREAAPENVRLRKLLGMREEVAPRSTAAVVVTANLTGGTRLIVVNRGREDGVEFDMPVIAWGGAVGRVIGVGPGRAKVRLLTDRSSGVAAVVQRSRTQGIVTGQADRALHLLYVPPYADVMHGDRVVTSGLDGIFPRGFGIGRVSSIDARPDGTQTIHLVPEIDYGALEEVLILLEPESLALADEQADDGGES